MRIDYMQHSAAGMRAFGGVHVYLGNSGLPADLLDLIYLRTSQINGCAYCVAMHSADALKHGVDTAKLFLVAAWREAGACFTDRERAALGWAEALTHIAETRAPDADYEAARAQFGEKELSDLTLAIGLMNAYNRIAVSMRREPDPA
jgi:AhpD family alkylhydroperoxidase